MSTAPTAPRTTQQRHRTNLKAPTAPTILENSLLDVFYYCDRVGEKSPPRSRRIVSLSSHPSWRIVSLLKQRNALSSTIKENSLLEKQLLDETIRHEKGDYEIPKRNVLSLTRPQNPKIQETTKYATITEMMINQKQVHGAKNTTM